MSGRVNAFWSFPNLACFMRIVAIAFFLFFTCLARAETPVLNPEFSSINAAMSKIGGVMVELFPVIMAKRELTAAEQVKLGTDIDKLVDLFHAAEPFIRQKSGTYQVSYQLVLDHLQQTKRALDAKQLENARKRLYGLGSICTSCHTQDTRLRTLFSGAERQSFSDDATFAEFNYLTRNYAEAVKAYDRYLMADGPKTELELIQPLQRMVTIYTQIYNDPGEGARQLSRYTEIKSHTHRTREHLNGWIIGLKTLDASGAMRIKKPDFAALKKLVRKYIGPLDEPLPEVFLPPEQEVSRVWLRGLLYHYLNTKPKEGEIAKILYWLAISDRSIGYNYYFSLADLYLKDCIINHSIDPYAERCFEEYNAFVSYTYSGSAGTFVPPEVEQELDELELVLKRARNSSSLKGKM